MSGDPGLVQKTVYIVRAVAGHPDGVGLSELSRETGISKATCHRILGTLEGEGWLTVEPGSRRFRLSLDLVFMAESLITEGSLTRYIFGLLRELAVETRETAGLDRLAGRHVMVLAEVPGPHLIGHAPRRVPRELSAWRTSTGRALLAWGDAEVVREDFEHEWDAPPASPFRTFDDFVAELRTTHERGYAVTRSELEDGLTAIAAPVHVGDTVPYAIWVSGPGYRLGDAEIEEAASRLIDAAGRLGRVLGQGSAEATGAGVPAGGLFSR